VILGVLMVLFLFVLGSSSRFWVWNSLCDVFARRLSVWWYVEPVERSRTSYEVLVRSVSNDNTVEELDVSGVF